VGHVAQGGGEATHQRAEPGMVGEQIQNFISTRRIALKEPVVDKVFLGMMNQVRKVQGVLYDLSQEIEIRRPAASIERQLFLDDPEELAYPAMIEAELLENLAHSFACFRRGDSLSAFGPLRRRHSATFGCFCTAGKFVRQPTRCRRWSCI
jgi:hypothetical protein